MEIRLLHLYHDLLNLYGEYGNVEALARYLAMQGVTPVVDRRSIGDAIDLAKYDFVYLGAGTERARRMALADLSRRAASVSASLAGGTVFLATGGAFSLFGKSITDGDGAVHPALSLFDFETVESREKRTLCDQVCTCAMCDRPLVGFINTASEVRGVKTPLFTVTHGAGNTPAERGEGFLDGTFYGTHLTGPCLVKNPHFASYFVKLLTEKCGFAYVPLDLPNEQKAYEITLAALTERFEQK